ncbi:MAG TPA: response regulator transcription factor [Polyangiaceae bacterium]|nr:response regulator transcription factor [Polyangiaceae bacterium]
MRTAILLVEPEPRARQELNTLLRRHGYEVWQATNLGDSLHLLEREPFRAVLLELDLPDGSGLELIEHVAGTSTRALVVSYERSEAAKVVALDRGANDYVVKPYRSGELLARLRVALRPSRSQGGLDLGALRVLPVERRVYLNGKEVTLTPTEFSLLHAMAREAGRVLTHRQLLKDVWGSAKSGEPNYLRVFIYQLRRKLELDPYAPRMLLTAPGIGYRLKLPC